MPSEHDVLDADGVRLGYVDRDGNIRRSDDERVVGHIANDRDFAVNVLRQRFDQYVSQTREWIAETRDSDQRLWRIGDIDKRLREVHQQFVLGDLDVVSDSLTSFQCELRQEQTDRIHEREQLIGNARAISERSDWKQAATDLEALNQQFKAIGSVGDRSRDQEQWDGLKVLERTFRDRRRLHFDQVEAEFTERAAQKEAICIEAESLEDDANIKRVGARFRELMDTWKEIGFAGKERDDALWARFNGARDRFNTRRTAWMQSNADVKEGLAARAEELAALDDATAAQRQMKPLMDQWRATGPAGKDADDALWQRFRGAQEQIYQRSQAVFDERRQEREANYAAKQQLIQEIEALAAVDSRDATRRCKEVQQEWKRIGPVPHEKNEAQWNTFRAACDAVFRRARNEVKMRAQDARDRAEAQIRKLSAEIDEHERKIQHWEGVIANLRDGAQAEEIRESMNEKIATARERIELKLRWIEEHHARMGQLDRGAR